MKRLGRNIAVAIGIVIVGVAIYFAATAIALVSAR